MKEEEGETYLRDAKIQELDDNGNLLFDRTMTQFTKEKTIFQIPVLLLPLRSSLEKYLQMHMEM